MTVSAHFGAGRTWLSVSAIPPMLERSSSTLGLTIFAAPECPTRVGLIISEWHLAPLDTEFRQQVVYNQEGLLSNRGAVPLLFKLIREAAPGRSATSATRQHTNCKLGIILRKGPKPSFDFICPEASFRNN